MGCARSLVAVLLVVKVFCLLTCVTFGFFAVEEVETFGFKELVDLCTCDTGEHFFGEFVTRVFTLGLLTLLVFSHGDKAGSEADGFVGELGLVLPWVLVVCCARLGKRVGKVSIGRVLRWNGE